MTVIMTVIIFVLSHVSTFVVMLVYWEGVRTYLEWIQSLHSINYLLDVFITVMLWLPTAGGRGPASG